MAERKKMRVYYEESPNVVRAHGREVRLSDLDHLVGLLSKMHGDPTLEVRINGRTSPVRNLMLAYNEGRKGKGSVRVVMRINPPPI